MQWIIVLLYIRVGNSTQNPTNLEGTGQTEQVCRPTLAIKAYHQLSWGGGTLQCWWPGLYCSRHISNSERWLQTVLCTCLKFCWQGNRVKTWPGIGHKKRSPVKSPQSSPPFCVAMLVLAALGMVGVLNSRIREKKSIYFVLMFMCTQVFKNDSNCQTIVLKLVWN